MIPGTVRRTAVRARAGGGTSGYFNQQFQAHALKVFLGSHLVSDRPDVMMVTTLGSCVAACMRDPVAGIGGMNHFLLPEVPESDRRDDDAAARYGSVAMERLINAILARGGHRDRLEAKLFGGARVIESSLDVGARNADFALTYLDREGIALTGKDLGGISARRVHWFPHSGRALRKMLRPEALSETLGHERRFRDELRRQPVDGAVELFGKD